MEKKKSPWRIVVFMLSAAYIAYMWMKKDSISVCASVPAEQALPMIATTAAVTLIKIAAIAGAIRCTKKLPAHRQEVFCIIQR